MPNMSHREEQYVGPYRLEKTLGKGQTGEQFFWFLILPKKDSAALSSHLASRLLVLTGKPVCEHSPNRWSQLAGWYIGESAVNIWRQRVARATGTGCLLGAGMVPAPVPLLDRSCFDSNVWIGAAELNLLLATRTSLPLLHRCLLILKSAQTNSVGIHRVYQPSTHRSEHVAIIVQIQSGKWDFTGNARAVLTAALTACLLLTRHGPWERAMGFVGSGRGALFMSDLPHSHRVRFVGGALFII